uniref:Trichohyalin-plectin-homology domain-containing protein n=1 Tax=Glossina pallidipes TaxID=7398 RepID=A0A1B0A5G7_GLOPL
MLRSGDFFCFQHKGCIENHPPRELCFNRLSTRKPKWLYKENSVNRKQPYICPDKITATISPRVQSDRKALWSMTNEARSMNDVRSSFFARKIWAEEELVKAIYNEEALTKTESTKNIKKRNNLEICNELYNLKHENVLRERHRIRMKADKDVRDFMSEIRIAKMKQAADEQPLLKEKRLEKERELRQNEIDQRLHKSQEDAELLKKEESQQQLNKAKFRKELAKQMRENELKKLRKHEEIIRDREENRKILEKYKNDQMEEQQRKQNKRKECGQQIRKMIEDNALAKASERFKEIQGSKQYLRYLEDREITREERRAGTEKRLTHLRTIGERIGLDVYKIEMEKVQRNEFLYNLHADEMKVKEERKMQEARKNEMLKTLAFREEIQRVMLERAEDQEKERKILEEEICGYKTAFAEYLAEQNEQNRKNMLKRLEYRNDLRKMIELRQMQEAESAYRDKLEHDYHVNLESQRLENVARERLSLLRVELKDILKYLSTKVLTNEERKLFK